MNEYKKAVLFDFDGTLVDLTNYVKWEDVRKNIAQIYLKNGVPAKLTVRYTDPASLHSRMNEYGVNLFNPKFFAKLQRTISRTIEKYEMQVTKNVMLMPGCLETLQWLKDKGIKIGIISLNGRRLISEVLKKTNIESYIDAIYFRDSFGKPKPFPDHALSCLGKFRCEPKNAFMVGDSPVDMLTAKRAKIIPIGITTGMYLKEELLKAGAHKTIENMQELIRLVRQGRG